jgi:hypothetical protein
MRAFNGVVNFFAAKVVKFMVDKHTMIRSRLYWKRASRNQGNSAAVSTAMIKSPITDK